MELHLSVSVCATTDIPDTLELLWTFDAGESIDSSAAIVDSTVYIGTYLGELIAIDLTTGRTQVALSSKYGSGIGESSPAVRTRLVFVGDLSGMLHAVHSDTGKRAWIFRQAVRLNPPQLLSMTTCSLDHTMATSTACPAIDGTLTWKYETLNYVHATPAIADGVAYFGGCDEVFRGVRITDGQEVFNLPAGAYTAASPVVHDNRVYFGTFNNEVLGLDFKAKRLSGGMNTTHDTFHSILQPSM